MHSLRRSIFLALAVSCFLFLGVRSARTEEPRNYISHGPILGGLTSDSVRIWARTGRTGKFFVRYGRTKDNLDHTSRPATTHLAHDNAAWVQLSELDPNTKYYYELYVPDVPAGTGRSGSFRTLPSAEEFRDAELNPKGLFNFSFEFACGNNQNLHNSIGPALPTFRTMLDTIADKINFAILNGDWLYEAEREYTPERWLAQVDRPKSDLPKDVAVAPTLVGVWENYKHFLSQGENLAEWHRYVPSFFTYDDHEILNDVWGAGTPGIRERRAVFRDIGVRAWFDYLGWSNPSMFNQPIRFGRAKLEKGSDILVDPKAEFTTLDLSQASNLHIHWGTPTAGVDDNSLDGVNGDPNAGVYEIVKVLDAHRLQISPAALADGEASYSIGRRAYFKMRISNCDFFFLDTRGQRDMHDVNQPDKPGIYMLGRAQHEWLLKEMKRSDADILFVVSSVNFTVPHVGGGQVRTVNKDDAWTVFLDEREALINEWDKLKQPVLVLTGDLHNSFAISITDNVWEFASGPHNSNNHWASDEGGRPANGIFEYGPRPVDIRWSTYFRPDIPRDQLSHPTYCVVQVNNVFNNPLKVGDERWVAFPRPQVIVQYFDGRTGDLRYAEAIVAPASE